MLIPRPLKLSLKSLNLFSLDESDLVLMLCRIRGWYPVEGVELMPFSIHSLIIRIGLL